MAAEPITQKQIDAYAELSTDRNPLHVDAEFASMSKFGGTIAHGFLMLGGVLDLIEVPFAEATLECQFHRPVRPGDRLEIREIDGPASSREELRFVVLVDGEACASGLLSTQREGHEQ